MSCDTNPPFLVTSYTAIAIAGPIMSVFFIIFMFGCNMVISHPISKYLRWAWPIAGGIAAIWLWSGFLAGFAPEHVKSQYLPANATLVNRSNEQYPCTELHNCVCSQSFDKPCAVVQNELMEQNATRTISAPCAGKSCCARRVYVCTSYRSSCSRNVCTQVCASGFYDCAQTVSASRCVAVGGICRKATADYVFTTECNKTVERRYEVTCRIDDQNCIRNFMNSMPMYRVIYYAPWEPTKQSDHYVEPKGQIVNIVIPLLIFLALISAQIVLFAFFMLSAFMQKTSPVAVSSTV